MLDLVYFLALTSPNPMPPPPKKDESSLVVMVGLPGKSPEEEFVLTETSDDVTGLLFEPKRFLCSLNDIVAVSEEVRPSGYPQKALLKNLYRKIKINRRGIRNH